VRAAIRDLLRQGGFKPTGRSKPASEYLAKAALESFPRISNLVDINNLVSLQTGWPCSILDLDLVGSDTIEVRFGRKDEAYVFNSAGQSIDVAGLICLARVNGEPIANPVKDSMATKVREGTTRALLAAYTSRRVTSETEVRTVLERVEGLLRQHAGATSTDTQCLTTA
jgi:DNA/RNA-binding domain of Phe-tRNA-synthetase-like protein